MDQPVTIGKILSAHGIKGEVRILPLTDFPGRLKKIKRVWVDVKNSFLDVESVREQGDGFLMKFAGLDNREEAEKLRHGLLQVELSETVKLPPGRYYHFEIVGLRVFNGRGASLGRIREIIETGANDIYVVERENKKDLLLPALKSVILEIDVARGRMVVQIPPGLDE